MDATFATPGPAPLHPGRTSGDGLLVLIATAFGSLPCWPSGI